MGKSPSEFDGKKVGAAGTARRIRKGKEFHYRPSVKRWGHTMRRKCWEGDPAAVQRMEGHIRKWLTRGARVDTIVKRMGISEREVLLVRDKFRAEQQDMTPRLVKKEGAA